MGAFIAIFGAILALDALIIMGLPLLFVFLRRPMSAMAAAATIMMTITIDYNWNLPEITAASLGFIGLIGLPAQVMPLSIGLMIVTLAICGWAFTRET